MNVWTESMKKLSAHQVLPCCPMTESRLNESVTQCTRVTNAARHFQCVRKSAVAKIKESVSSNRRIQSSFLATTFTFDVSTTNLEALTRRCVTFIFRSVPFDVLGKTSVFFAGDIRRRDARSPRRLCTTRVGVTPVPAGLHAASVRHVGLWIRQTRRRLCRSLLLQYEAQAHGQSWRVTRRRVQKTRGEHSHRAEGVLPRALTCAEEEGTIEIGTLLGDIFSLFCRSSLRIFD